MDLTELKNMVLAMGQEVQSFIGRADERANDLEKAVARALSGGTFTGSNAAPASGFKGLGEYLLAVVSAGKPGGVVDERLLKIQSAATGASEGVPSDGGFLLAPDLAAPLTAGAFEVGQLAKRCFQLPIGANANSIKIPAIDEKSRVNGSRFGGIQSYWAAEAATVTATKPKWRTLELELKKLFALSYSTEELLMDAPALGRILSASYNDEMSFKVDDSIINGTGAGQPLGILNSGCLVSVAKETGQRADTIVFENILKMYSRMLPRSRKNAVWLINQSVEPQLFAMSLAVGTGGVPVYLPASGAEGKPFASLMGLPVVSVEQCPVLGDAGDIILADLSSYVLATKGGIQAASSIHVQFIYDEMTFRWTYRLDGAPLYESAITPYKGSATLSPFVTLAERA